MAVTKITWENKTGIQNDASVARKNKVTDEDMNEIKQVVNNNADELDTVKDNIEDLQGGQGTANTDITSLKNRVTTLESSVSNLESNKVDKVEGKGLSTEDFTTELKTKLEGLNNYDDTEIKGDISNIQQEQQTQNTNIEGLQENDIEQDELISKLQEDNQKLKNALLNAETEEAKSLYVEDANRFGSLEVLGNQEQETSTQGKNYFTGNKIASGTEKGVTYSFDNSILKMNGTTTSNGNLILDAPLGVKLPAGTYTWTIKVSSGNYQRPSNTDFAFYLRSENNYITGNINTSTITGSFINNNISSINFTITEETEIYLRAFINAANIVFNNLELEIQIESGSEYTEFEQFIPNMPSPNYPSEVVCLGSNKNKFNKDTVSLEKFINASNGVLGNLDTTSASDFIEVNPSSFIILSGETNNYPNGGAFYDNNKNYISGILTENIKNAYKVPEGAKYIRITTTTSLNNNIKLEELEEGNTATSYSPHRTR